MRDAVTGTTFDLSVTQLWTRLNVPLPLYAKVLFPS
jgi:hypothetical protein